MRFRKLLKWAGGALLLATLLIGGAVIDMWKAMGARARGTRMERMIGSPQFSNGVFQNSLPERTDMWSASVKWMKGAPHREPSGPVPVESRRAADYEQAPASGLRVTWLGHSSMLVELEGRRVLFDPVFGERCSPSSFYGPRRFFAPPLPVSELPELDAVVISHDHYDHLDQVTIEGLRDRGVEFVTPLGVGAHLELWGVPPERITELDWWQETQLGELRLVSTPARHFSGRGLRDRNATLWSSWALIGREQRVYFSGDTAMFPGFQEIGERLGPFDLTMIEVGAYDAAWADVHLGPEQAVAAHQALRGKLMVPVHWGTFNLALHAWTEPAERLLVAAEKAGVRVVTPKPGGFVEPARETELVRWWPAVPWQTAEQHPVISSGLAGQNAPPRGRTRLAGPAITWPKD